MSPLIKSLLVRYINNFSPSADNPVQASCKIVFIVSLLITSLINFCSYQFSLANHTAIDIRELSLFGSHIRYGILLSFGLGVCFFLSRELKKYSLIWICTGAWFIFYTYYSQILSGLIALLVVITITITITDVTSIALIHFQNRSDDIKLFTYLYLYKLKDLLLLLLSFLLFIFFYFFTILYL